MNAYGRLFRLTISGESHGKKVGVILDGCPAGLPLQKDDFLPDLKRRQSGPEGTTARHEPDIPVIETGILEGKTTGAPIMISILNRDLKSEDYQSLREKPRPGHADYVAWQKYKGFNDPRGGGIFSGRLTAALVSAGVIAKKLLSPMKVSATLQEAGGMKNISKAVQAATKENDSIGGIIECRAHGLPVGLGEPFFDSTESVISHLVFSIPAIKGIEFGSGFACSRMRGSKCNDIIVNKKGETETNHAGGINGGITNGNELIFRVAVKPPSSIGKVQRTVQLQTGKSVNIRVKGRHDVCIALRMPVIVEAAAAIGLTDLMLMEQKIPRVMR